MVAGMEVMLDQEHGLPLTKADVGTATGDCQSSQQQELCLALHTASSLGGQLGGQLVTW